MAMFECACGAPFDSVLTGIWLPCAFALSERQRGVPFLAACWMTPFFCQPADRVIAMWCRLKHMTAGTTLMRMLRTLLRMPTRVGSA